MRPEGREQRRLAHDAGDPPAGLGGVVEHGLGRHAADVVEHGHEAVDQALAALRLAHHAEPRVGVRPADGQLVQLHLLAGDDGARVPVVNLAGAARPLQLEEPLAGPVGVLPPPLAHEALDGRERPAVPQLRDQPVVHAPGRVPLLARPVAVALEPRPHRPRVRLHRRAGPRPRHGRLGREVPLRGVLGHGVPADPELAGDLALRASLGVHRSDKLLL